MNNNIQCSIESSTTKIELNSAVEGVFLVPELEGLAGLPEIRTTSGVNAGYDGGWTSAQNYDARLISIRGVIANPDISKVEDKRRAIASLLGQGRKEQLTLRFTTEAGNAYAISVRTISCEMALQRVLTAQEFLIQLRADDPLIYDDGATGGIAAILQPQRALGGFEINFGLPLAIGGGAEDTVVDNGNETVYPVIKLYGALHSPTVVNRTTNQQMQILADLQYSIDWHTYRSTTGDYILVNDGLDGAPMTLSQLLGNATQTTYSGKNLADYLGATYLTQGVSITKNAPNIVVTKNSDGEYRYCYFITSTSDTNKMLGHNITLSFSKTSSIAGRSSGIRVFWASSGGLIGGSIASTGGISTTNGAKSVSFSVPSTIPDNNFPFISLLFYPDMTESAYGSSSVMTVSDVQLEIGTATSYEPYVGGTASPNPDYPQPISTVTGEQTVKVAGKNLFDISKVITNGTQLMNNGDGTLTVNLTGSITSTPATAPRTLADYCPSLKVGDTVVLSAQTTGSQRFIYLGAPSASTWVFGSSKTITQNDLDGAVYWYASGANTSATISYIQLELGSTATAYEPYQGQSYTIDLDSIELAKIGDYQDRIYKDDGKWYIEKQVGKIVFDGATSEQWAGELYGGYWRANHTFSDIAPIVNNTDFVALSDYFHVSINVLSSQAIEEGDFCQYRNTTQVYFAAPLSVQTSAEWRTWLSTHPTTVYYALATPTTTEITDDTLLSQLNFLASLYGGVNNISLVGTGAQGEMTVRYATDYTVNQDIITIDSQARTITLNGQDVYHLKTSESEFLVLAPGENKLYLTSEVSDDSGYAEVKFKQGYLSI